MNTTVKRGRAPRTLRAEQVSRTRRRILEAATALFLERGYAAATMEAIAAGAGVAVETVYSRFRSKVNLLAAILEVGIVGADDGRDLFERSEIAQIRAASDQCTQLRRLAAFSKDILERTDTAHRILHTAAAADPTAARLRESDTLRRREGQRVYIDMLLEKGPLRHGLTPEHAADTYSVLSSPETYAFLVGERGWTPEQFQHWLAETLIGALL